MVRVYNREGHTDSSYLRILNLGYPTMPSEQVQLVQRNHTQITVQMPEVAEQSQIISYQLWIDNGEGRDFSVVSQENSM